ncbi:MAG: 30S ribosomal protein S1 [Clostridia bacterium]|nr:30S ribosomal protein S1 [Clostridia bacterium]
MTRFFPEGELLLTQENRDALQTRAGLEKAAEEGRILEARARLCDRDMTLFFDLGGVKGVMPREEVQVTETGDAPRDVAVITRVGKPCAFRVLRLEADGTALLSRRAAQEDCLKNYLDTLETGDVLPARVTHFEPFGAFCDVGCGIPSLLSIDCMSVSRISHPSDRFSLGENILAAVRARDEVTLGRRGRISLTHKELLGTWRENAARFSPGETVLGIARSVESYGIFVELMPNLAGLAECRPGVNPGDRCSVYIKSILPEKRKVKLVIVDAYRGGESPVKTHYFIREGNVSSFRYDG